MMFFSVGLVEVILSLCVRGHLVFSTEIFLRCRVFRIRLTDLFGDMILGFQDLSLHKLIKPLLFKLGLVFFENPNCVTLNVLQCFFNVNFHVVFKGLFLSDFFQHRVESIFHLVLCPAVYLFSDRSPLIADFSLFLEQD